MTTASLRIARVLVLVSALGAASCADEPQQDGELTAALDGVTTDFETLEYGRSTALEGVRATRDFGTQSIEITLLRGAPVGTHDCTGPGGFAITYLEDYAEFRWDPTSGQPCTITVVHPLTPGNSHARVDFDAHLLSDSGDPLHVAGAFVVWRVPR